jgi:folate-binding protein YgfZ
MTANDHYDAVTRAAGLVDRSDRSVIVVEGQDRAALLHNILTNDITPLRAGEGCYAAYLTPQGRMVSDMRVLAMENAIWLDVPGALTTRVLEKLDRSIFAEDVRIGDRSGAIHRVGVYGPLAAETLARAADQQNVTGDLNTLPEYHHRVLRVFDVDVVVARDNDLGVPGFALYVPGVAPGINDRLMATGVRLVDAETAETLRVEAGRPRWGAELDEDVIPIEAGIESRAISFTKGCYIGQEVIVRILHRGHGRVARRLVGLIVDRGGPMAVQGDRIAAGDRDIGVVTSGARSPALDRHVALGYVHRDFVEPGTRVVIQHDSATFEASIAGLPFRSQEF